jgi:hypothetical protein
MVSPVNRHLINKCFNLSMVSSVNKQLIKQKFQSRHGITSKQTPNKTNGVCSLGIPCLNWNICFIMCLFTGNTMPRLKHLFIRCLFTGNTMLRLKHLFYHLINKCFNLSMVSSVNRQLIKQMFKSRHGITSKQTTNKQNVSI